MENNLLLSYNFLATLTEQGRDLYQTVYIPICKRALCHYSLKRKNFGTDKDIQDEIFELYGLKVPLSVVRQLLRGVFKSMSRKEKQKSSIKIFEKGKSFQIELFEFDKYERAYELIQEETELLQTAFYNYAKTHPEYTSDDNLIKFSEFINRNKTRLSYFFSGQAWEDDDSSKSFLIHAQFLEYIQINNPKLFEISEKIYFGSIVASYLEAEIDINAKFASNEEYFIDTQIVLRALDIQDEFETQPAKELIDLIITSGATPKILGITISEIDYAFQVAIENYDKDNPITTINKACIRRGKNKRWLISEQHKIESRVRELGILIEKISSREIEKYKKSKDINLLQDTRKKKANAEHDVLAYLHIRHLRGNMVRTYQKAKYWFVSSNINLYKFNISTLPQGVVSEVITPDSLTSLLWLKGNSKLDAKIKRVGLNELIIQTIHEEIATSELINELHKTVKSNSDISEDDYKILLYSVAHQSAKRLNNIINLAEQDKNKYNAEIHQIIEKERERRKRILLAEKANKEYLKALEYDKKNLDSKLTRIEEEISNITSQSEKEITTLRQELAEHKTAVRKIKISLLVFCVSIIILFVGFIAIKSWNSFKLIITSISGLGGLWSFINLFINISKSWKK